MVDALHQGNLSRFLNAAYGASGLMPNCAAEFEHLDLGGKRMRCVAVVAVAAVAPGEELLIDYGEQYWRAKANRDRYLVNYDRLNRLLGEAVALTAGLGWLVFTDIARDGLQTGLNLPATAALAQSTGLSVIASGGVSRIEDMREAKAAGLAGCIVGRALYEGSIDPQLLFQMDID